VLGKARQIIVIVSAQEFAVALGIVWGFRAARHASFVVPGGGMGLIACLLYAIEGVRFVVPGKLPGARRGSSLLCWGLFFYGGFIICLEPFMAYDGDYNYFVDVFLLFPFILSIGPLARARAWFGTIASVTFFSASIAMLTHNACCRGGSTGFFRSEVY
jgi:hypothetical protein